MSGDKCRLCLVTDDLVWIFSKNMPSKLSEIIYITSGVQILRSDVVTQMICNTCYQLTKKMYQFRNKSIKNDKELKARHEGSQLKHSAENIKQLPPIADTFKSIKSSLEPIDKFKFAHPSIKEILTKYPNIILPPRCLKSHVGAYITLLTEEIHEYFQDKGLTDVEIEAIKKEAGELYSEKKKSLKRGRKRKDITSISPVNKKMRRSSESSNTTSVASESSESSKKKSPLGANPKINKNSSPEDNSVKILSDIKITIKENLNKTNLNNLLKEISKQKHNKNFLEMPKEKLIADLKEIPEEKNLGKLKDKVVNPLREILKNCDSSSSTAEKNDGILRSFLSSETLEKKSLVSLSNNNLIEKVDDTQHSSETTLLHNTGSQDDMIRKKEPNQNISKNVSDKPSVSDCQEDNLSHFNIRNESTNLSSESSSSTSTERSSEISFNTDSDLRISVKSAMDEANKNAFVRALQLTPKVIENSNMPDLSLVSVKTKSYTLYTCRVCDSQHTSLKDLKMHSRKTHTKCPLCNKKFRSSTSRDKHVTRSCPESKRIVLMKEAKLILTKIEDDDEIQKKYSYLFADFAKTSNTNETTESPLIIQEMPVECESAVTDAITEIEHFLNEVESSSEQNQVENVQPNEQDQAKMNNADVICISDDESEASTTSKKKETEKINIVKSEFLNNINLQDSDVNIFKKILMNSQHKPVIQSVNDLLNCRIEDSNNSRVKVFKDLRKFLHHYKIPIELYNSQTISAEVKPRKPPNSKTKIGLWTHLAPQVLTPYMNQVCPKITKLPTVTTSTNSSLMLNNFVGVKKTYSNSKSSTPNTVSTVVNQIQPQASPVTSVQNNLPTMNLIAFAPTPSNSYPHPRPTLYLVQNSLIPQPSVQTPQTSIPSMSLVQSALRKTVRDRSVQNNIQQLEPVANSLRSQKQTINNPIVVTVSNPVPNVSNATQSTGAIPTVIQGIRVKNLKELS